MEIGEITATANPSAEIGEITTATANPSAEIGEATATTLNPEVEIGEETTIAMTATATTGVELTEVEVEVETTAEVAMVIIYQVTGLVLLQDVLQTISQDEQIALNVVL